MGKRSLHLVLVALLTSSHLVVAREDSLGCGTHAEKSVEQLAVHRQALRMRPRPTTRSQSVTPLRAADIGDIAVLEDSGDVIVQSLAFNLDQSTISFIPTSQAATLYRFETGAPSYDSAAAAGTIVGGMADDDSRRITIPFSFPFYGRSYRELYINSDGNLTFNEGDAATAERSLGRVVVGPPRIAPLFRDLDPTRAAAVITVTADAARMVVSWVAVPEYSSTGTGPLNTFQMRLFSSGRIEFAYNGIGSTGAVVGISPGSNQGSTTAVTFLGGTSAEYGGTVAQRFADEAEVDVYTAALKFYETHEDAYDYLVFFNTTGTRAAPGALAYEMTVRNPFGTGYGDSQKDFGWEFGSPRRLLSIMNMGPLSQYPADPDATVPNRGERTGDTGMTLLGHEAGHLFLAFASVRDPLDPTRKQMVKSDGAHWSFNFNSEASLLEGNRIVDVGGGAFQTAGTVEGYSPLDQYLMGLLPSSEVPPTFVVLNSTAPSDSPPRRATTPIIGTRRDVHIEDIIHTEGRRTPDHAVAQRRFRFAFILIVPQGTTPSADAITTLELYRSRFPSDFNRWTGGRAFAETTLRKSVRLSVAPAAGLVAGSVGTATLSIQKPATSNLTFSLERSQEAGFSTTQSSVTIAAGSTSVSFAIAAIVSGVGELTARPSDPQFETAYATIKVLQSASGLRLSLVSSDDPAGRQAVYRVTDLSGAPYAGTVVSATASGGTVSPATTTSDQSGLLAFLWTPSAGEGQQLTLTAQGAAPFVYEGVVNSASFLPGLSPGSFASVFGFGMAGGATGIGLPPYPNDIGGVELSLGGRKAGLHYSSDRQLNFVAPLQLAAGTASLAISAPTGSTVITRVPVVTAAPGIFFWGTNDGAILRNQNFLEIYCTGLGAGQPVTVTLGGRRLAAAWSGPNVAYPGLYQVNVEIPADLTGEQTVSIEVGGRASNEVKVRI